MILHTLPPIGPIRGLGKTLSIFAGSLESSAISMPSFDASLRLEDEISAGQMILLEKIKKGGICIHRSVLGMNMAPVPHASIPTNCLDQNGLR
jgi:hypothetical protein